MKSTDTRRRPDGTSGEIDKLETLPQQGRQQKAMALLEDCQNALVAGEVDRERFFQVVLRVRAKMADIDRFDHAFEQLVTRVATELEEQADAAEAERWREQVRNRCGELLNQSDVPEGSETQSGGGAGVKKSVGDKLPVPISHVTESSELQGPGSPAGLFAGMRPAEESGGDSESQPESGGLGVERTEPRFFPAPPADRQISLKAQTLWQRLARLATVIDERQEAAKLRVSVDGGETVGELLVFNGAIGPVMRVHGSVVIDAPFRPDPRSEGVAADGDLESVYQRVVGDEHPPAVSERWAKTVAAAIGEMVAGGDSEGLVAEVCALSKLDAPSLIAGAGAVDIVQHAARRQGDAVPAVARRVYEIAASHQAARWLFVGDPEEPSAPLWLPVDHAAVPKVDMKAVAGLGRRLAETAAVVDQFGDSQSPGGRMVTFRGEQSQKIFAFDDTGGCLVDIEPRLLGVVVRAGQRVITGEESTQPESQPR